MVVHRPSSGTCWGLAEEGAGQLRQDISGESQPQEVPTLLSQGTQHLVRKHWLLEAKCTEIWEEPSIPDQCGDMELLPLGSSIAAEGNVTTPDMVFHREQKVNA